MIKQLESKLLILHPGGKRRSTDIVTNVMNLYADKDPKVMQALESLNGFTAEIIEALRICDLKELSSLLERVRREQLKLHPDMVNVGNLRIIDELKREGVNGVKLLGGGGPGACMLVVCIDESSQQIVQRVTQKNNVRVMPVQFSDQGLKINF